MSKWTKSNLMGCGFHSEVDVLKTDKLPTGVKRLKGVIQMSKHEFLKRTYLQFFNDEGEGGTGGEGSDGKGAEGEGGEDSKEPKQVTMTQEEYDKSIQKRLDRGQKSWEKQFHESEDYKAFQEFQDGKKTADEKIQEQLKGMDALKQSNADMAKTIQGFEQKSLLTKADVNPEFTEFVTHKLQSMVNDDVDFGTALETFKTDDSNAKYFGSQQQQQQQRQGQRHGGKGGSEGSKASDLVSKMYGGK